jgi:hypothetical protein
MAFEYPDWRALPILASALLCAACGKQEARQEPAAGKGELVAVFKTIAADYTAHEIELKNKFPYAVCVSMFAFDDAYGNILVTRNGKQVRQRMFAESIPQNDRIGPFYILPAGAEESIRFAMRSNVIDPKLSYDYDLELSYVPCSNVESGSRVIESYRRVRMRGVIPANPKQTID